MLMAGGGLCGGDSNLLPRPFMVGSWTVNGNATSAMAVNSKSLTWILEARAASCETGCWQHEFEPDIAAASQLCAIFSQHCRSSAVICQSGDIHAMVGRAENDSAIRRATNLETLGKVCVESTRDI